MDDDLDVNENQVKTKGGKKSKKDRRKKKDDDDGELEDMLAELALEIEGKKPPPSAEPPTSNNASEKAKPKAPDEDDDDVDDVKSNKKKKNKKKGKEKENIENNEENKKLTNEKNIQKKKPAITVPEPASKVSELEPSAKEDEAGDDGSDDDDTTGKKDKKKKKKDKKKEKEKEKEAPKGKGPSKKQIAMMQEILKKQKEEEERLQREEEERIRQEEERERLKLEKERLEKEKREKKKQKEKERKLRLKKEGKLLNPKQKEALLRAKQALEQAKKSGQIVIGKAKKDDQKKSGGDSNEASKSDEITSPKDEEDITEPMDGDEIIEDEDEEDLLDESLEDDVLDDWEDIKLEVKKPEPKSAQKKSSGDPSQQPATQKSKPNDSEANKKTSAANKKTKTESVSEKSRPKQIAPEDIPVQSSNPASRPPEKFRSPIICVLGHVDTGKTKLLDYIRKTHIQDNEAGGITQQIGATFVPPTAIQEQCKYVKTKNELKIPGLLIIDTPGHESFSNLRSRGSSLCDIAILVIDIMHGLENQTIESLNLLKSRKTPFVVALNKIDRLYEWRSNIRRDVQDLIASQQANTRHEFNKLKEKVIVQLAEQSINAALFYENPDPKTYVSLVPTSAHTGDGMGNLINLITNITQNLMAKRITYLPDTLDATVLEVKALHGLGTTIDVILVNGKLREGDKIVLAGHDGPIVTNIRALLVPQPLKELRVKSPYEELKVVYGSVGVKIAAHDLEKAVAGLNLYVANNEPELERLKEMCWSQFGSAMKAIKCSDKGVYVQASTLGALEALLEFLKQSKIPYSGVRIGPVAKRDVMKASIMLEHSPDHAVILAFDVKIDRDAQELADHLGVKIFHADIIYHLFDQFTAYKENLKKQRKEQNRHLAVFPCKLRILPNCIFNKRDPIVVGVHVEEGRLVPGTPLAVPSKELDMIGRVSTIEHEHKAVEQGKKGDELCIKIEHCGPDAPKLYGRHFDHTDPLYSRITRESIDIMKEHFRDELDKSDWQLMIELKKVFNIL